MSNQKPNILIFISDHLSQKVIDDKCNEYPNIGKLAEGGVSFAKAYCNFPLCVPSRTSFWTGRYPHQNGIEWNSAAEDHKIHNEMTTLGEVFHHAGYETVHFGKRHDADSLKFFDCQNSVKTRKTIVNEESPWNDYFGTITDRRTTELCIEFLNTPREKPFVCVADFFNPHDILPWMDDNIGTHKDRTINQELPPLPDNFEIEDFDKRSPSIQNLCCRHRRLSQAGQWTEENYRHYLAAYYHYVQNVDQEIGKIMNGLKSIPEGENTLVVLMADHGNGMCAHRMVSTHGSFYDEITRVPLIFSGKLLGRSDYGKRNQLVSLLDLFPTLCEYAGISIPEELPGKSLWNIIDKKDSSQLHEYVVSEWRQGSVDGPVAPGRMIRTENFKYIRFLEGDSEEFYNLETDPGETQNLIDNPKYLREINKHRNLLMEHIQKTNDPFLGLKVKAQCANHKPGYQHHIYNEKNSHTMEKNDG